MPGPTFEAQEPAGRHGAPPPAAPPEPKLAITLPEWNLLPPTEFLDRHPRQR
jgi:hypothetical protein